MRREGTAALREAAIRCLREGTLDSLDACARALRSGAMDEAAELLERQATRTSTDRARMRNLYDVELDEVGA